MRRYCLIGPTYPYRGGIAHYMTLLSRHLSQENEVLFISFASQYPRWLFPGRSDRDPSTRFLKIDAEYLLEPLNPLSWRRTLRRLSQWQPEVVVIPWWVPFWAPAWAVLGRRMKRQSPSLRLLFICHNIFPHERGSLDRLAARTALSPGDGFIVHSNSDAQQLQALIPGSRIKVNPLPTYSELVDIAPVEIPVPLPRDVPLILFCGLVRPYKGLDILIEAMPEVISRQPVHLLIAGEFWKGGDAYKKRIGELGLTKSVTVLDQYIPNEVLVACIDRSRVIVLPYRSATQSAVVQLAYGRQKPVITTDVGGLSEAVSHGRTGLVIPPENPQALADAINRFFGERLGPEFERNIALDMKRFSWQQLIDKLDELAEID